MRYALVATILSLTALALSGCSKSPATADSTDGNTAEQSSGKQQQAGGIAVVDLDKIAQRLGRTQEINQAIKQKQEELNQQLAELQNKYKTELEQLKELYGDKPTEKEAAHLAESDRQLGVQLTQAQRNSHNELAVFRQGMIDRYREEVRPVARRVAADRGLTIVVTRNDRTMLSVDPASDITEAVLEQLIASQPAKTVPPEQATPLSKAPPRGSQFQKR